MKKILLFSFAALFILFSCSEDPFLIDNDENSVVDIEISTRSKSENPESIGDDIISKDPGLGIALCENKCRKAWKDCLGWARENRIARLTDCRSIIVIDHIVEDEYCTRSVIVGYTTVISNEGEVLEFPIYEEEMYVCDQHIIDVLTEDPILIQEYEVCKRDAIDEFVEALDDCDIGLVECLNSCRKPKESERDGFDLSHFFN